MKEHVAFKMNEYNHRISNKIDDFVMFSAMKKDAQQVVYQPIPIYLPPMYPSYPPMPPIQPMQQMMPQYMPD